MGHRPVLAALAAAATVLTLCAGPQPSAAGTTTASDDRAGAATGPASSATSLAAGLTAGGPAWVRVSVATVWRSPSAPRRVDAPALARPARITRWLSAMTVRQRRALNGRADTQVLLGDRVRVVRLRPGWAKVVVPGQPTPLDSRGYPGWVPRRQLTATRPSGTDTVATVVARLAWLRTDEASGARALRVSYATRLPVLGSAGRFVRVETPGGAVRRIRADRVSVHDPATPALPATRAGVVADATMFRGLDYLWAGRSGFGFDCSGLTSLVYRVHGLTVPRDAAPQSRAGRAVSGLRRGDLLFYATDGVVHHVSMYVGRGRMVHSPRTGSTVQVIPTDTPAYAREYAGARRFLG